MAQVLQRVARFDGNADARAPADVPVAHGATEWYLLKALKPAMLPHYYEERTTLRMTPTAVDVLQDADVADFQSALAHLLPGFAQFPEPAQEALLDMAFQLGAGGLMSKFPHLALAAQARDWQACADQCHRAGIQEWRNTRTAGRTGQRLLGGRRGDSHPIGLSLPFAGVDCQRIRGFLQRQLLRMPAESREEA